MKLYLLILLISKASSLNMNETNLAIDYFAYKNINFLTYFSCDRHDSDLTVTKAFMKHNVRVLISRYKPKPCLERILYQWNTGIGILTQGSCGDFNAILNEASKLKLFDAMHIWLTFSNTSGNETAKFIAEKYNKLNLSVDTDIAVVAPEGDGYSLIDVFNFGKIQGNQLETTPLGIWREESGLVIWLKGFKYYNRWNFQNLTLRAISVILDQPNDFQSDMLSEIGYTRGVAAMTKIASQQLNLLKEVHNFRFNYSIAGRWIGAPQRNSTLAVSNALYWEEQDISSTTARIFPHWLAWVDILFPPMTYLEKNTISCGRAACRKRRQNHPQPGGRAFARLDGYHPWSKVCRHNNVELYYEDGIQISDDMFTSQGRKLTLLIVGLTSMLLYNYYTSSVVSWLLNAAAPSIASLDALINSDFELIFEDIGYTRGWLDNPGFFYYSGYENPKEDILRDIKVTSGKRTMQPLQPVEDGLQFIRTGKYAYHTEPYTASQVISKTFEEKELCELGSLPMMFPAQVYIYSQRRSPYKQFFVWSLMRLSERGHLKASQARFAGTIPACSGSMPRALALGQAAPAFALLIEAALLALCIMLWEILWSRSLKNRRAS
ncbi:hypothetical protein K1T71_004234 [Dendrolimus kikuchii]|uniref:Uncharacterized protein n=1 Tax=Dendrolimus kikuchii TaxID=765133 RepID=A0ACC1D6W4_9NEOP|nr:hypothetical protein K1T71_004234 [Dendrolimus kikuchii]